MLQGGRLGRKKSYKISPEVVSCTCRVSSAGRSLLALFAGLTFFVMVVVRTSSVFMKS